MPSRDPDQRLARPVAARGTPEALVVREGKTRYRGRIGDRHQFDAGGIGQHPGVVGSH
ncbi:MAG TPA: hypothetical protein PJ994_12055 [Tepidiformaceae bacterium]|nr:hypothetical protein [Tepidiformaceae bacterium]